MLIKPQSCRTCKHGKPLENIRPGEPELECRGGPPQVIALVLPGQNGPQISVQTVYPRVKLDDDPCGVWKPRIQVG